MTGTKAGGKQTAAQRAASERNLRMSQPAAFTKPKPEAPRQRTYRARSATKTPAKAPDPVPAPPAEPAVPPPAEKRKGGFLDDVFERIFG